MKYRGVLKYELLDQAFDKLTETPLQDVNRL